MAANKNSPRMVKVLYPQQQLDDANEQTAPELCTAATLSRLLPRLNPIDLAASNTEYEGERWFMGDVDSGEEDLGDQAGSTSVRSISSTDDPDEWVMGIMDNGMDKKSLPPYILDNILPGEGSAEPTNPPFALSQDITDNFSDVPAIGSVGCADDHEVINDHGVANMMMVECVISVAAGAASTRLMSILLYPQQQFDSGDEQKRVELLCASDMATALSRRLQSSINLGGTNREQERERWFMKTLRGNSGAHVDSDESDSSAEDIDFGDVEARNTRFLPPNESFMDDSTTESVAEKKTLLPNILDRIILDESMEPTNLPFALLRDITENFSDERKIGSGGFANVYKGSLINGSVAVKKLLNSQTIEEGAFYREANFLMNVKHPNIVRFLGFCANTEDQAIKFRGSGTCAKYIFAEVRERLFCFEYISNGNLGNHLTDELKGLEWHTRYQIIKGICEGLQYLHKEKCILHMDLKPANVLLDHCMVPKITDFGISRRHNGLSLVITKERLMSLGYCAPEYLLRGEVSFKSDIYGLGVIIQELVTGRKEVPSIKNVLRRWRYRWNKSAMYPPLGHQQVTKCIELAVACMEVDSKRRPFISDIVSVLNEMDSTVENISSSANESVIGQVNPYPWELLSFDPLELSFPFEPNKQISCTLKLTNERDDQIGFEIQATNPYYEYKIEPNKGVVPPRSECSVTITLEAQQKSPQAMMCMDQLTVRMAVVEESLMAKDITPDMFDGEMGNMVDELDLAVVFTT